jgi:hypothetical protein
VNLVLSILHVGIRHPKNYIRDVSDKLNEIKLARLFVLMSRSRPRWGGKKKKKKL